MIHLRNPTTGEYLRFTFGNNGAEGGGYVENQDRLLAAGFYPDDIDRIRRATGVDWIAVPIPSTKERQDAAASGG